MSSKSLFIHRADEAQVTEAVIGESAAFSSADAGEVVQSLVESQLAPFLEKQLSNNQDGSGGVTTDSNIIIASESDDCGEIGMAVPLLVQAITRSATEHNHTVLLHVFGIDMESGNGRCMLNAESAAVGSQPLRFWNKTPAGLIVEPVDTLVLDSPDKVEGVFEENVNYADLEHLCCECILVNNNNNNNNNSSRCRVTITCFYMGSNPSESLFSSSSSSSALLLSSLVLRPSTNVFGICSLATSEVEATNRIELVEKILASNKSSSSSAPSLSLDSILEKINEQVEKLEEQNVVPSWNENHQNNQNDGSLLMELLLTREYLKFSQQQASSSNTSSSAFNFSQLSDEMIQQWKNRRHEKLKVIKEQQQQQKEDEERKQQEEQKQQETTKNQNDDNAGEQTNTSTTTATAPAPLDTNQIVDDSSPQKQQQQQQKITSPSNPGSPIRGMGIWNHNNNNTSSSSSASPNNSNNDNSNSEEHEKRKLQEAASQLESDVLAQTTDEHQQLKKLYHKAVTAPKQPGGPSAAALKTNNNPNNNNNSNVVSQEVSKSSSIVSISQLGKNKGAKLPPLQVFKYKIVLLGHQEVGKTSLRLCFQSDPFFFKRLPDVQSTTGIEATDKVISIENEEVDLSVMDFAGQESYHSHTLFLTQRTVFVLVWKISAVEQHFTSRGISEHEEARICRWITEVYSKFPKAPVALCATHLDELRDQSQKNVESILNKVGNIIQNFIAKISEGKSQMPIVGNFAVSCKNRVFTGTGSHAKLAGSKMSVLLGILGKVALMSCKADPVFWGGAIPGRHIRLIQEIQELQKKNETMLLSLSDYIRMAVKTGIESDEELLEVSQLMHSWNILYLFNQHKLASNVFLFLHPQWMCKLAGVLFSMAHVINTPLHLRSVIGGLEYGVSNAEGANMGLLETGFLRFPLVRVIFRKTLTTFLQRDPHDGDMELCVQILVALELIARKVIETEDPKISQVETPSTVPSTERNPHLTTRYFVPSLSPYLVPDTLRRLAPLLFPLGVHIKFDFSFLPDEFWWRFQHRMHRFAYPQSMACGEDAEDEDDTVLFQLKEARELHNYWRDGMWLGDASDSTKCRVLVLREFEPPAIRIFSASSAEFEETCEGLLQDIEQEMSELLSEYKGLQRHVRVECPEPSCFGFFDLATLPSEGEVQCMYCRKSVAVSNICVNGSGPLGRKVFPIELTSEMRNVAQRALDDELAEELMKTVHGEVEPVDPVRLVDDMLLAFMHREALDIAQRRAAKNDSFAY